jgi:hypothetical protein
MTVGEADEKVRSNDGMVDLGCTRAVSRMRKGPHCSSPLSSSVLSLYSRDTDMSSTAVAFASELRRKCEWEVGKKRVGS